MLHYMAYTAHTLLTNFGQKVIGFESDPKSYVWALGDKNSIEKVEPYRSKKSFTRDQPESARCHTYGLVTEGSRHQ